MFLRPDDLTMHVRLDGPSGAPALVGEHDASTPLSSAEALRDAIPGANLHLIPGAAHIPTIERPGAVTDPIRCFLAEHQESIAGRETAEVRT